MCVRQPRSGKLHPGGALWIVASGVSDDPGLQTGVITSGTPLATIQDYPYTQAVYEVVGHPC